jgi:hypothetical protein
LPDFTANVAFELWQHQSTGTDEADSGSRSGKFSVVIKYNGERLKGLRWCGHAREGKECKECENGECDLQVLQKSLEGRAMDAAECEHTESPVYEKDTQCCEGHKASAA